MSTLDEITKEKQRVGEALSRVDAQREQLVSQLRELEAAERVLARYTKGPQARKMSSAKSPPR
jgi:outer membrane protein TolC